MPATTDAFSQGNFEIEVSEDNVTWTSICGTTTNVNPGDPEHNVGEQFVACAEYPVLTPSDKIAAREIQVDVVYTETTDESFDYVYSIWLTAGRAIYLRWSPAGGATGDNQFTTSQDGSTAGAGYLTSCTIPEQDASSEDPAVFSFTVKAAAVIMATIA